MDNLASFINESKTQAISVTIGATEEAITAINQDLDSKYFLIQKCGRTINFQVASGDYIVELLKLYYYYCWLLLSCPASGGELRKETQFN